MRIFKLLSVLLSYPEQELVNSLDDLINEYKNSRFNQLKFFFSYLKEHTLIELQENYVATFDRTPNHSLHMFEHLYGESRMRGGALVDLLDEYQQTGLDISQNELPDYLPLFLEFLSLCEENKATQLLGEAIHIIAHIGEHLTKNNSPYCVIFEVLKELSPQVPEPLSEPPVRDMDEALEVFGINQKGIEPLLVPHQSSHLSNDNKKRQKVFPIYSTHNTYTKKDLP